MRYNITQFMGKDFSSHTQKMQIETDISVFSMELIYVNILPEQGFELVSLSTNLVLFCTYFLRTGVVIIVTWIHCT